MKRVFLACAIVASLGSPLVANATVQLPDLGGEPYQRDISFGAIKDAFFSGNFVYGTKLIQDLAYREIRQKLNDEKLIPTIVAELAKKIEKILSDSAKTDAIKSEEIVTLIESSLGKYESAAQGDLAISLKHSIDYGVTKVIWDKKVETDRCEGGAAGFVCYERYQGQCTNSSWTVTKWTDYVQKVPDYYLYRVVDGQDTLLTKLAGRQEIHRESLDFSANPFSSLWSIIRYDDTYSFDVDGSKAIWYDFNSDYRNKGQTLSYKVVADNGPYKFGDCGTSERYETAATADSNGDGKMDFIPDSEYQKRNAWLVPVIALLLQ